MPVKRERLDDLIGLIYEAALDSELWPHVVTRTLRLIGGTGARLHVIDGRHRPKLSVDVDIPLDAVAEYDRDYLARCPRVAYGMEHPEKSLVCDYMPISEKEIDRNEIYDFFRRTAQIRYFIARRVRKDDGNAWLSIQRSRRQGHAQARELKLMQTIGVHVEKALTIAGALAALRTRVESLEATAERMHQALVLLAPDGSVDYCNTAATKALAAQDGLFLRGRAIHAQNAKDDAALRHMLARLRQAPPVLPGAGDLAVIRRPSGQRPYVVRGFVLPVHSGLQGSAALRATLLIHDPCLKIAQDREAMLALAFGLTPAEAKVAVLLAEGQTVAQAADTLDIAKGTVRVHLESIFRKTGVRRQSQLVGLVLKTLLYIGTP